MNASFKRLFVCAAAAIVLSTGASFSVAGQIHVADAGDSSESDLSLDSVSPTGTLPFTTSESSLLPSAPAAQPNAAGDELTIAPLAARCRLVAVEWQNLAATASAEFNSGPAMADPTPLVDLRIQTASTAVERTDASEPAQIPGFPMAEKSKAGQHERAALLAMGMETLAL